MLEDIGDLNEKESIKVVVLGDKDPRLMSKEEFENSSNLLYHGSSKGFRYYPSFDYNNDEYLKENDASTTLGTGFYAVDNIMAAQSYSKQRQNGIESKEENILPVLPFNARMIDFRKENDLSKNENVPKEFALKWREYFNDYLSRRQKRDGNIGKMFNQFEDDYSKYLDRVLELEDFSLRVLLMTESSQELRSGSTPSPLWSSLFSKFVIDQGYDGIIYNEKVEGSDTTCASYVFYNTKKIGTYDSWNSE